MSLSYAFDQKLALIAPILEEHAEWFNDVMRRLLYPEAALSGHSTMTDANFRQWLALAEEKGGFESAPLQTIRDIFADLRDLADALIAEAANHKPTVAMFDQFTDRYDDFVQQVRRLEHDAVLEDSGMDGVTGLRSRKAMEKDLERELERRARLGKPFCLVLARMDGLAQIRAAVDEAIFNGLAHEVAVLILLCIRSFDDAYRLSDGEFVLALKHSDTAGGVAAINRLRRLLEENPINYPAGNVSGTVTMSYCTAEPIPGDLLETLLHNMRSDLDRYDIGGDSAVEYIEQSPLQRYVLENELEK